MRFSGFLPSFFLFFAHFVYDSFFILTATLCFGKPFSGFVGKRGCFFEEFSAFSKNLLVFPSEFETSVFRTFSTRAAALWGSCSKLLRLLFCFFLQSAAPCFFPFSCFTQRTPCFFPKRSNPYSAMYYSSGKYERFRQSAFFRPPLPKMQKRANGFVPPARSAGSVLWVSPLPPRSFRPRRPALPPPWCRSSHPALPLPSVRWDRPCSRTPRPARWPRDRPPHPS